MLHRLPTSQVGAQAPLPAGYYDTTRREILPFLPAKLDRMLDVGCGEGATTAWLRSARTVGWAGGIEVVPTAAALARPHVDALWVGDVQELPLEQAIAPASLDLVLALDVLEHLVDPWSVVRRLSPLLAPGGRLILSVPNVRNLRFVLRLAFLGDFHYRDHGLLDRTHLRFFVRSSAVALGSAGGLTIVTAEAAQRWRFPDHRWFLHRLTGGASDELFAKQWLVVAEAR